MAGRRKTFAIALAVVGSLVLAGCTGGGQDPSSPDRGGSTPDLQAQVQAPASTSVVDGTTAAGLANAAAAALFTRAPVAVLVTSTAADVVTSATTTAEQLGVPVLVEGDGGDVATRLAALGTTTALRVGGAAPAPADPSAPDTSAPDASAPDASSADPSSTAAPAPEYPGVTIVDSADQLPATAKPASPLTTTSVLVRTGDAKAADADPAVVAGGVVSATATAAGATVVDVAAADPRSDAAAITALQTAPTGSLLAVGTSFGTSAVLTRRIAVARTGVQLPGGGQTVFPGRAFVALYGYPGSTGLGVLGEQGPAASVARAKAVAAPYDALYDVPVVPTFEIIATVAAAQAGADGDYSNEAEVSELQPLVDAATAAGLYVVLDLQPGRADMVAQAERYTSLLAQPNVGLALDPEWKLTANQVPLQQIGSVTAEQVNAVITWLSDFTAKANLPQKLLVLHQFRISMLQDEDKIVTNDDNVAVLIHADGQGAATLKEDTWAAIVANAPPGVALGWKNFYDEDPQMLDPAQTVDHTPKPLMVSYQ